MKLKFIASAVVALIAFPSMAAHCPEFSIHQQYYNGDEIQKDGAFFRAQNDPHKGVDVSSSWFWQSIPECQSGLSQIRLEHPHRFLAGVKTDEILAGDGITNYTSINQNQVYVANKTEGTYFQTYVRPTDVTLSDRFSVGRSETKIRAGSLKFEESIYGKQDSTTVDAQSVKTSFVEAEKMIMAPMAVIGDRDIMAYIKSLEARIADLEAKLAQQP
ncbi:hypothetical protein VIBNISOn1_340004 [Vibrio nigripulchritudo SOn1]|uniref:Uncharacterized protein n=1 Tax=Vibrio nigripulchritudo SOn1 TaxID=1238450 RepID=A0AAV2VSM1_9VIBR|nr:hypothetical protein [Vibrio nigripulchritudo]CCO47689.1 hypothetical protein VIBNISOn1_340004 [Vibrio nigripulchritudo SOn1]